MNQLDFLTFFFLNKQCVKLCSKNNFFKQILVNRKAGARRREHVESLQTDIVLC